MNKPGTLPPPNPDTLIEAIVVSAQLTRAAYLRARELGGIPEDLEDWLVILNGVITAAEVLAAIPAPPPYKPMRPSTPPRCNGKPQ